MTYSSWSLRSYGLPALSSGGGSVRVLGASNTGLLDSRVLPSLSVHFQMYMPAPSAPYGVHLLSSVKLYWPISPAMYARCCAPSETFLKDAPAPVSVLLPLKSAA